MAHETDLPEFHDSSIAAVRLLQGAVYVDDGRVWDLTLNHRNRLSSWFVRVGLVLVINEPEGFAYLRQLEEEEQADGYENLPRLMRRTRMGYDQTMLCVILRDELRRFDEQDLDSDRCVVAADELFDRYSELMSDSGDEVRRRKRFEALLVRIRELGFIRDLPTDPPAWEIRPILKARLTTERLEELKAQLAAHAAGETGNSSGDETDKEDDHDE